MRRKKGGKWGGFAAALAEEIVKRMPHINTTSKEKKPIKRKQKTIENGIFLDTSAIIDGRIFEVANIGLLNGVFIVPESILLELKHIADSQEMVRREKGRNGLEALEKLKSQKK